LPQETLQGGPPGAPVLDRLTPTWRRRGVVVIAVVLGVIAGGGVVRWTSDPPEERPSSAAAPDTTVRLVLSGVATRPRASGRDGGAGSSPLRIDGVLLHSRGPGTATVTRIHRPGGSLSIRVRALPVTLSANDSFERVRLQVTARDCALATRWTPSAQPFTLTWRDDQGEHHTSIGGDHDASMELSLIRHMDAVCDTTPEQ
jgi:hypothetical protein